MYNPVTDQVSKTRYVTWLHQMFYQEQTGNDDVYLEPQVILLLEAEDAEARGVEVKTET